MNIYTKQIMAYLKVSAEVAMMVQDLMTIDFSECTREEFFEEVKMAYYELEGVAL